MKDEYCNYWRDALILIEKQVVVQNRCVKTKVKMRHKGSFFDYVDKTKYLGTYILAIT